MMCKSQSWGSLKINTASHPPMNRIRGQWAKKEGCMEMCKKKTPTTFLEIQDLSYKNIYNQELQIVF